MTETLFYVGQGGVVLAGLTMFLWGLSEAKNYWHKKETYVPEEEAS